MADFLLSLPLKLLPTPIASKLRSKTFHPFTRLPAELRLRVWSFALEDEPAFYTMNRSISISKLKGRHRVTLSQRYSSLFAVNRESRYEATKALGGEWVRLEDPSRGSTKKRALSVYINFNRDTVLLRGCTGSFDGSGRSAKWHGRPVAVWQYGRNLDSSDPMYTVIPYELPPITRDC